MKIKTLQYLNNQTIPSKEHLLIVVRKNSYLLYPGLGEGSSEERGAKNIFHYVRIILALCVIAVHFEKNNSGFFHNLYS